MPGHGIFSDYANDNLAQGELEMRQMFRVAPLSAATAGSKLVCQDGLSIPFAMLGRGWAYRVRRWPNGRQAISEFYLPGDIIGVHAALRMHQPARIVALQPVMFQAINPDAVPTLLARRPIATYLLWLQCQAQRRAEERGDQLIRLDA
jgi:CRP-like cAMP-binding protein